MLSIAIQHSVQKSGKPGVKNIFLSMFQLFTIIKTIIN